MGGGVEQVTAPELGNEAQNEGLSASGRALGCGVADMLLEWSCQQFNMLRTTLEDPLDSCVTPLGENNTQRPSHALPSQFGTPA